jgi:uncharacterized coiled-coil protein SlyX
MTTQRGERDHRPAYRRLFGAINQSRSGYLTFGELEEYLTEHREGVSGQESRKQSQLIERLQEDPAEVSDSNAQFFDPPPRQVPVHLHQSRDSFLNPHRLSPPSNAASASWGIDEQRRSLDLLTSLQTEVISPQYQLIHQLQHDLKTMTDRLGELQEELGKKKNENDSLRQESSSVDQLFAAHREESHREAEQLRSKLVELEDALRLSERWKSEKEKENEEREGQMLHSHQELQVLPPSPVPPSSSPPSHISLIALSHNFIKRSRQSI